MRTHTVVDRQNHVENEVRYTLPRSVMNDAGVGRLLVASLHQGIADMLPTRLEFYEAWLSPSGFAKAASAWHRWRRC